MITANQWFKISWDAFRRSRISKAMAQRAIIENPTTTLVGSPLKAYVNQGRWLVSCECGGAEYAWEEGIFMCQSCWNGNHKHYYRASVFPNERKQIETLLEKRPLQNRNWEPNETLTDLRRENKQHKEELL